ncbi:MAG: rhodanese-like domain-containing protein [Verrucomicrobiales bacterium]|nr:rhodanese-like domain-containing protein [Verrucomicrobiales bacterium]
MKTISTLFMLRRLSCVAVALALGLLQLPAVQPAEVQRRMQAGEKVMFIDVRSTDFFQKGHVPGAMNVPVGLLAEKRLPKLGRVVLYDDGLGGGQAETALPLLNAKPGIQAEILEGGFAGWTESGGATTAAFGISKEEIPMITYQKLKAVSPDDVVLVDLRTVTPAPAAGPAAKSTVAAPALTDLRSEFPGMPVTKSPFALATTRKSGTPGAGGSPLLVLVDNGDGKAEETARALRANGATRFVILAGGERTLSRQGQPGLQRLGQTVEAPADFPATITTSTNRNK